MVVAVVVGIAAALLGALYHYIDTAEVSPDLFSDIHTHSAALGYSVTAFDIPTPDGYILSLFRLSAPGKVAVKPVLFIHGVGVNGDQFTVNYHAKPVAYRFVDEAYDVWIANTRGSPYSDRHIRLSHTESEFWDWTAEDIMKYDVPAMIDKIVEITGKKVALVGHSQGALVALGVVAMMPEYSEKVSVLLAIACPSAKNSNESWIFKLFTHPYVLSLFELFGKEHFFRRSETLLFQKVVSRFPSLGYYYIRSRYDPLLNNDIYGLFDVYSYRFAGGTSLKNLRYYSQNINSNDPRPRLYDFGEQQNLQRYNSTVPPQVDFATIRVNVAFFGGKFDMVVKPQDLQALIDVLPREKVVFQKIDYQHDHGSFALSRNQEHVPDMLRVVAEYG